MVSSPSGSAEKKIIGETWFPGLTLKTLIKYFHSHVGYVLWSDSPST
jgi:hypothetical protein